MSVIDNIERLVLADPNVTAEQIAKALGYSEEKSVYYWLSKSGYAGMRDFKKAVLKKAVPLPRELTPPVARESTGAVYPVYSELEQKATGDDLWSHLQRSLGSEAYCVLITESRCEPIAGEGDILLVDPDAPCFQGDLQLACVRNRIRLVRQYAPDGMTPLYVDALDPGSLVTPDYVSGRVMFILRKQD